MQRTFFFKAAFLNFPAFPRSSFPRSTSITAPGGNIKLKSAATRIRSGLTVDVVLYPPHNLALHLDQVVAVDEHAVNLKTNQLTSLSLGTAMLTQSFTSLMEASNLRKSACLFSMALSCSLAAVVSWRIAELKTLTSPEDSK